MSPARNLRSLKPTLPVKSSVLKDNFFNHPGPSKNLQLIIQSPRAEKSCKYRLKVVWETDYWKKVSCLELGLGDCDLAGYFFLLFSSLILFFNRFA